MSSLPNLMPRLRRGSDHLRSQDGVGWASGTCFEAYGVRVGVRSNQQGLLAWLEPHLPPGWAPTSSSLVDQLFSLWVDPRERGADAVEAGAAKTVRAGDLQAGLTRLESEMRQGIAARSRRRTFVHAGVVGHAGLAIVIPGRSRSGKTTLVAELVRAGALYYSDEFAVLDSRGRVHPFAKPLSVRGANGCDVHARRTPPEELGGARGEDPLPVGLVVLATHRPGATWSASAVTPGEAVLEMLTHTVPARVRPEASLRALEKVVSRARVLKGERGEARELAGRLLDLVERTARTSRRRTVGERGMR